MGGHGETLRAPTKKELETKAREWVRIHRESGLEDIRRGWHPVAAHKAEDGMWEIDLWAHT